MAAHDARTEREQLVRIAVLLETLTDEVKTLDGKLERELRSLDGKFDRVNEKIDTMLTTQVATLTRDVAVQTEKVSRLERFVYGCVIGIVVEFVGLIAQFIVHFVAVTPR